MPTAQTAQTAQTFTNHPSRHRPDHCTLAENYCRLGATNAQLAELFEVPGDTLQLWLADLPDFAEAVSLGRATADAEVAESFYRRAKGYDETVQRVMKCRGAPITVSYTRHHLPNAWAGLNWLCNRRPQNWSWHGKRDEAAEDPVDLYAHPLLLGAAPVLAEEEDSPEPPIASESPYEVGEDVPHPPPRSSMREWTHLSLPSPVIRYGVDKSLPPLPRIGGGAASYAAEGESRRRDASEPDVRVSRIATVAFPLRPCGPPPPMTGEENEMCPLSRPMTGEDMKRFAWPWEADRHRHRPRVRAFGDGERVAA